MTWCVVPVFNHSATLRNVVDGVLEHISEVIVVDDGSTDADIVKILDGLPIQIIRHEKNLGKGAALKAGARFALKHGGRNVIAIDADGQHDPMDLPLFLDLLSATADKIVVGKRDFASANVPFGSRFGRGFSDFWVSFETGLPISDSQSGFRAYPAEYLANFNSVFKSYAFETEILVRAVWDEYEIVNVDISVSYFPNGKMRISHFNPFIDNFRISLLHARLTAEYLFRKLVSYVG
jgi:glycosyltransferase involved in cell wall biosynthesis